MNYGVPAGEAYQKALQLASREGDKEESNAKFCVLFFFSKEKFQLGVMLNVLGTWEALMHLVSVMPLFGLSCLTRIMPPFLLQINYSLSRKSVASAYFHVHRLFQR